MKKVTKRETRKIEVGTVKRLKQVKKQFVSVLDNLIQAEEQRIAGKSGKVAEQKKVFWMNGHAHPSVSEGCCVVVVAGANESMASINKRLAKAAELTWSNIVSIALDVSANANARNSLDQIPELISARLIKIYQ